MSCLLKKKQWDHTQRSYGIQVKAPSACINLDPGVSVLTPNSAVVSRHITFFCLSLQRAARWVSGANGEPAPGETKPVALSGVWRPERGTL